MSSTLPLQVMFVLGRWDPEGLAREGTNPGSRYETVANDISAILRASGRVTLEELNAVWFQGFGKKIGTRRDAQQIASQLSDLDNGRRARS